MTHAQQLEPHAARIQRAINRHYNPAKKQTSWEKAFAEDPTLEGKVLFGTGTRASQKVRLLQSVQRMVKEGKLAMPTSPIIEAEAATNGKVDFNAHAALLKQIATTYAGPNGKVAWRQAFAEHPEWREQIGLPENPTPQHLGRLGYWAKNHLGLGGSSRQQTAPSDSYTGPNFCPNCRCDLRAVAVAMKMTT